MTTSPSPHSGDPAWKLGLQAAWKTLPGETDPPDDEMLAAYVEGTLTEAEREQVEAQISVQPEAMSRLIELQRVETQGEFSPAQPVVERPASAVSATVSSRRAAFWIPLTTLALIACAAVFWGVRQSREVSSLLKNEREIRGELATAREKARKLTATQHRRAISHKEQFLALAENTRLRNFWAGNVTPSMLQLEEPRGAAVKIGAAAKQHQTIAREAFEDLASLPEEKAASLLELAALELAAGRPVEAGRQIEAASKLEGETPRVQNARAMLSLAQAKTSELQVVEKQLRSLTRDHPKYVPGWYNLALLLEKTGNKTESKNAWQEYLKREDRDEFRKIAQAHLTGLVD